MPFLRSDTRYIKDHSKQGAILASSISESDVQDSPLAFEKYSALERRDAILAATFLLAEAQRHFVAEKNKAIQRENASKSPEEQVALLAKSTHGDSAASPGWTRLAMRDVFTLFNENNASVKAVRGLLASYALFSNPAEKAADRRSRNELQAILNQNQTI
ncbi:MAG: hypothetical protein COY58_05375 [Gammaproteobacteria bacterium CG_4_10_14_0_8_um_filter_38_16]|nr:MAG: hypothetical protein COY58_05375 [Gammaproteobacteria bacterium CG_4_10_14_0_8_um_filter_38_16]PJA03995.1 MAG: hypothetical protein COX72_02300 [Gammaproteobacteria bacterium CG_4_10_14_0_2_um_filter_38_22]PJB09604.1 MAG: hypothetical protein CO120_09190 [Gammaproteobacteria bacterium CG_4_9_14_3_um_filter_38_9]